MKDKHTQEEQSINDDIHFREEQDNISSFAQKNNLDEVDVRKYAESMRNSNLGGAAYAFHNIRRKLRLDSSNDSFVQFSNRFAPIKEKLYEEFGNIDKLRDEAIRITMEERNVMEAARKRVEEEAANERGRLQEFQDMSDEQLDSEYFMAIDENNEPRMRDLVYEAARRKGYEDKDSSYQGVGAWVAPADPGYENAEARRADFEEYSPDVNIEDIAKGYSPQPDDYFTHLKAYGQDTPEGKESAQAINKAINEIRSTGNIPLVKVYRAVPTSIEENTIRNGDWVSLSKKYAEIHGKSRLEGKYRIIEQEVPANKLWWDGNDIKEWGYDDGKDYRYKNVENNRKLNDLITRADNGNIIPLSQRFDSRNNDVRFRFIGEKGAANLDRAEEATVRLDNLTIAREMEFVGKDALSIKIATGWERGADDKWRYEDHDFEIRTEHIGQYENDKAGSTKPTYYIHTKMSTGTVGKLTDFVHDDNLFQAYPQLIDTEVKFVKPNADVRGTASDGVIALSINYFSEVYEILNSEAIASAKARTSELYERIPEELREESLDLLDVFGGDTNRMNNATYKRMAEQYPEIEEFIKSVDDVPTNEVGAFLGYRLNNIAKGVLSHEIQHAIQHIEGFAHGGSPIQFSDSTNFEYDIRKFNSIVEDVIQGNKYEKLGELLKSDRYSGFRESFTSDRDKEVIRVLKMWYNDLPEKVFMENYQYSVENGRKGTASEQYYKLSGEVEARNVQSRINMTDEEKRNSLAVLTEDVRREDQIFLKNSFSESMYSPKVEFIPVIESLANTIHTPIDIINDINDVSDDIVRKKIETGNNVKGWFVPTTNKVAIYLPNIVDLDDAKRTVFHEAVAHYGLRKMFGEHFDIFLDNVYNNATSEIQGKIMYATHGEPAKRLVATEEYLAKLSEKGFNNQQEISLWKKVKFAFMDMLRQSGVKLGFKLHDNDLRGILYKSYLNQVMEVSADNTKFSNMKTQNSETIIKAGTTAIPCEILEASSTKIKLVVYNEYALGYIHPETPDTINTLSDSVIKGVPRTELCEPYYIRKNDNVRLANEKDFDDFRVDFKGYSNKNIYEYSENINTYKDLKNSFLDDVFKVAVEEENYKRLSQLKDEGYVPTKEMMQTLSSIASASSLVAIQKIYGLSSMGDSLAEVETLQNWLCDKSVSSMPMSSRNKLSIDL